MCELTVTAKGQITLKGFAATPGSNPWTKDRGTEIT